MGPSKAHWARRSVVVDRLPRTRRLAFEQLEQRRLLSISARPLGDLNPGEWGSSPSGFTALAHAVIFAANDDIYQGRENGHGCELWKIDGTPGGTELLKDIRPGDTGSYPGGFTEFQGRLYFSANDGVNGTELWVTDGTADGTRLVKDINPGANSSSPANLTVSGGRLFFAASTASNGTELWASDGSADGAVMVKDLYAGNGNSSPRELTDVNGVLFFAAGDALWRSDGTSLGTTSVREPRPGTASSGISGLTALGNRLIFSADDGDRGSEIWESDGTLAGTRVLKDLRSGSPGSAPWQLAECNGFVYFCANDGTSGSELWRTDGTFASTQVIKDIFPGENGSAPLYLTNVAGRLYFQANDGTTGVELWTSDGSAAGTALVKDILPGGKSSNPLQFTSLDGYLIFRASDGNSDTALWRSQGTADTTFGVGAIVPGESCANPWHLTAADGKVYLSLTDGVTGNEPWVVSVVEQGPTIGALVASPNPVSQGDVLTLTATGVEAVAGRTVVGVRFYRESNGAAGLQSGPGGDTFIGTDSDPAGGWSTSADSGLLQPGSYTSYAQAIDDQYDTSSDDAAAVSTSAFVQVPLQVTSTVPAWDQGPIAETSTIDVTFSEPIDPATLDVRDVGLLDLSNPVVSRLSRYALDGEVFDVTLQASLLYAVTSEGLEILDVSDPAAPTLRGRYSTPGSGSGSVEVVGDIAYYVNGGDGLVIVDVSDPAAPRWLGTCTTPSQPYNVEVVGGLAYVADFDRRLEIIDVADPTAPTCVGQYVASQGVMDVEVVGHLAYLGEWNERLEIVDVSDPASPAAIGSCPLPGAALDLQVIGDRAYVAAYIAGFQVVDVSNPASPLLLGGYATTGWAFSVEVVGNLAYVADDFAGQGGLEILDISESDSIRRLGGFDMSGHALAAHIAGSVAYVADAHGGVEILQVGRPATAITHLANNTYRIDFGQRLQRHDYALQLGPEIQDPPGKAMDQDGDGTDRERGVDAYCTRFTVAHLPPAIGGLVDSPDPVKPGRRLTLTAENVVDPNPTGGVVGVRFYRETNGQVGLQTGTAGDLLVAVDSSPNGGWSVQVSTSGIAAGSYTYYAQATDDEGAMSAGDMLAATVTNAVHTPLQVIATSPPLEQGASGPIASIDVTFNQPLEDATFAPDDVSLFDIDNLQLNQVGAYGGNFQKVVLQGSLLYAATGSGLQILDVSRPSEPRLVGQLYAGPVSCLTVQDGMAYLGMYLELQVIDISNPAWPVKRCTYETASSVRAIGVKGNLAYVADGTYGLRILDVSSPAAPRQVGEYRTVCSQTLALRNNVVYLSDSGQGLVILDVSDPTSPRLINQVNSTASLLDVAHDIVYTSGGIIDVSDPYVTRYLASFPNDSDSLADLQVVGNLAFLATSGGLKVFDVRNPAAPKSLGTFANGYHAAGVTVGGNLAYVADGYSELRIFEIGPSVTAINHVGGNTYRLELGAALSGQTYNLQIGPELHDLAGFALDQDGDGIEGEKAEDVYAVRFVITNTAPTIARLADSPDPVQVGQAILLTATGVTDADPSGSVASVRFYRESNEMEGLQVGTAGDTLLATDADPSNGWSVSVSTVGLAPGQYIYYAQPVDNEDAFGADGIAVAAVVNFLRDPLRVVSTTPSLERVVAPLSSIEVTFNEPLAPDSLDPSDVALLPLDNVPITLLSSVGIYYSDCVVDGSRLYAATWTGLEIWNIADRTAPVRIGGYDQYGQREPRRVYLVGDRLYLVQNSVGLQAFDVSDPTSPRCLGTYQPASSIADVAFVGARAYLLCYSQGLEAVDLSDPASPVRLGGYSLDGGTDIQVVGSLAYVAAAYSGLDILEVSDPSNIKSLGHCNFYSSSRSMEVVGHLAYVSGQIIDVADPVSPRILGYYSSAYGDKDLDIVGSLGYVVHVSAIDIVDLAHDWASLATWPTDDGQPEQIEISGSYAYVPTHMNGLEIYQIGLPATSITHLAGSTYRIDFGRTLPAGEYAFLLGPEVVSVSGCPMGEDQNRLSQEGCQGLYTARFVVEANGPPTIRSLETYRDQAYVGQDVVLMALGVDDPGPGGAIDRVDFYCEGNGVPGLQIGTGGDWLVATDCDPAGGWSVDISTADLAPRSYTYYAQVIDVDGLTSPAGTAAPQTMCAVQRSSESLRVTGTSPALEQGVSSPFSSIEVTFSQPVDPATFSPQDVAVIELNHPQMSLLGTYRGKVYDCVTRGPLLYASTDAGFQILDVSNPAAPIQLSNYPGANWGRLKLVGNIAYLSGGGLSMLDVSNPAAPRYLGRVDGGLSDYGVDVVGSLAYIPAASGLEILDVTDPSNPVVIGVYDSGGTVNDVRVVGHLAYLAAWMSRLEIVDISNPAAPVLVGRCDLPGSAIDLQVVGDRVYVADYISGFCIVDVSNPAVPQLLGRYQTPGWASAVEVVGHLAFVTARELVHILDVSDPSHISQVALYRAGYGYNASVAGDRMYVATAEDGLQIVRIGWAPISVVPMSETTYRVDFGQTLPQGDYVLLVGSEIQNPSGTLIDQGGDGVDRERWNDAYFARVDVSSPSLDADADGVADSLTDGILILRYLFDPAGRWTFNDALSTDATRVSRGKIRSFLDFERLIALDVDGNGTADALTDGILILRYLFDPQGGWDYQDALGTGATRTTREQIKGFLDQFNPSLAPSDNLPVDVDQGLMGPLPPFEAAEVEETSDSTPAADSSVSVTVEPTPMAEPAPEPRAAILIIPPRSRLDASLAQTEMHTASQEEQLGTSQLPIIDPLALGLVLQLWPRSNVESELVEPDVLDDPRAAKDAANTLGGLWDEKWLDWI